MEEWVDIKGYPGYKVSSYGRVSSVDRFVNRRGFTMKIKGRILKYGFSMGYPFVNLRKNGAAHSIKVHRLVAEAFIENPDNKPEIDHINTNRKDNRVDNLRWVNRSENNLNPITRAKMSESKRNHNKNTL